jgi:hypothetical protein
VFGHLGLRFPGTGKYTGAEIISEITPDETYVSYTAMKMHNGY